MTNREYVYYDKYIAELKAEISELREQLIKEGKNSIKEVRQAYLDIEEYFFTVSHELKTPLREISLYAQFIEEDNAGKLTEESSKDLISIRQTCDRMVEMIHLFMEYSRADQKVLNREVIKMESLVRDCFANTAAAQSDRSVDLEILELPEIIGDKILIRQMVNNILSNCVKFTKNISEGKIRVFSCEEADTVNFCFEDNGTGFDMRYASDIFEIFGRVHNESDFEGYGIGLATVKKIVERFEGSVEIFGMVNKGCIVTVKLPKNIVIPIDASIRTHSKKKDKIIIGAIGALSGDYSEISPCRKFAYQLAVDEINANGGINGKEVELIFRDFQSDASKSAELAWQLIEIEQANVIMGGVLSSAREEIRKVADKTKTLYFYNALYEGGVADHYTFCVSAVPEQNLYPMLEYLVKKYGNRCYIITADYNYGVLTAESAKYYIKELGGEVVAVEYFQASKSNFDVTIDNINETNPDILLSFCVSNNQHSFYKQWYDKGIRNVPIVSTIGIGLSFQHKVYEPPTMKDFFFMCSYIEELESPNAKAFTKKYVKNTRKIWCLTSNLMQNPHTQQYIFIKKR